jgi:hypothetical protein
MFTIECRSNSIKPVVVVAPSLKEPLHWSQHLEGGIFENAPHATALDPHYFVLCSGIASVSCDLIACPVELPFLGRVVTAEWCISNAIMRGAITTAAWLEHVHIPTDAAWTHPRPSAHPAWTVDRVSGHVSWIHSHSFTHGS